MATLKKDQYACKGGPEKFFFLPGPNLPATIKYSDLKGFYRKVYNPDSQKTTYVWENK
jgi:hypothetical protein